MTLDALADAGVDEFLQTVVVLVRGRIDAGDEEDLRDVRQHTFNCEIVNVNRAVLSVVLRSQCSRSGRQQVAPLEKCRSETL